MNIALNIKFEKINDLCDQIFDYLHLTYYDIESKINNDLNKPDGNPRKLLDSSLINSMGWKSRVNLDDGLVKTYDWYRSNI